MLEKLIDFHRNTFERLTRHWRRFDKYLRWWCVCDSRVADSSNQIIKIKLFSIENVRCCYLICVCHRIDTQPKWTWNDIGGHKKGRRKRSNGLWKVFYIKIIKKMKAERDEREREWERENTLPPILVYLFVCCVWCNQCQTTWFWPIVVKWQQFFRRRLPKWQNQTNHPSIHLSIHLFSHEPTMTYSFVVTIGKLKC